MRTRWWRRMADGLLVLWAAAATSATAFAELRVIAPRCEYRENPACVDEAQPLLDWRLEATDRGQVQTAYQVLVASAPDMLSGDKGDLWDSGKVASDATFGVAYAGKPLVSAQRVWWKVRAWDREGVASAWSAPATWAMGLLKADDWQAQWIGLDAIGNGDAGGSDFGGAKWIWYAGDKGANIPVVQRVFRGSFTVPAGSGIESASLVITADDSLECSVNGTMVAKTDGQNDSWRTPRRVDVTKSVHAGVNVVAARVGNLSASPAGLLVKLVVKTADGRSVVCASGAGWKCAENAQGDWQAASYDDAAWPACRVVCDYGAGPWGNLDGGKAQRLPPARYLRHGFRVAKAVRRATVYATALGLCDVYVNGRRVSDDYFTPGWTDYTRRVHYQAYDVTDALRPGDNAVGAVLADGWFCGYVGYGHHRDHYGKKPRFLAQVRIEYADGSVDTVATGPEWTAAVGPTREADFLMGEMYDARLEPAGWAAPGFDASAWSAVDTGAELKPVLEAHPGEPVRVVETFKARSITEPKPGVYVLDLGQNFAGVPRLRIRGKAGQTVVLRFAERLNPDGTVYTTNLRSARATDTYICRGGGEEVWSPRFTFHGFQYIEVTGLDGKPDADTVVGLALSSATPVAGRFACSDEMLNRLHSNVYWTQRANFIDIPTDCPQRDERLGWTGDAQVYVRTATLNTDVQAFFNKWLIDLEDAQRADGQFPCVAPLKVAGGDGGPAWADAGTICPWTLYDVYGDRRELARHYGAMKKFIAFCKGRSTPELLPPAKFHCFGDWLSIKANTPKDVIYTAYFAYSTKLTAKAARVLGKPDEAGEYEALFDAIKAAFNKAYVAADGRIKGNTQCVYVLALAFDLVDGRNAELAARYLVEDIESRDWHLSTGFIGTKDLMLVLAKIGRNDVACRLMHQTSFPSWGFSIQHGATSIWERWDGWTPEKGFQTPGMNSFAHYSFGAVYQWMVENLGGIRAADVAYKRIEIAPTRDDRLSYVDVSYDSVRGKIVSAWKREGERFELTATIPPNTTATIYVPAADGGEVTESGKVVARAEGVKFLRREAGCALYEVGGGTYRFVSPRAGL